jgi:hypothetical protein
MVVKIKIKVKALKGTKIGKYVELLSIANSGYETDFPEVLLPQNVAKELGIFPLPLETKIQTYHTPACNFQVYNISKCVEVGLGNKKVLCDVIISEFEDTALMSDALISALKIDLVDVKRGIWKFRSQE